MQSIRLRARTTITRAKPGGLVADSEIPVPLMFDHQYVEMIAHEIEHVIEQSEGLDLRKLAHQANTGVHRSGWGGMSVFETDRAMAVGETVEREFLDHPLPPACAGTSPVPAIPAPSELNRAESTPQPETPTERVDDGFTVD